MRRIINSIILLAIMAIALPSYGQGLKAFKLKNGLSVYIWEDNTKSDVYGIVACRTGSVNDPAEYTGLAHYLEHVMFKGRSGLWTGLPKSRFMIKSLPSTMKWRMKPIP